MTNQTCGPLETEGDLVSTSSLSLSQWPTPLAAFVPVPVFADLYCISFQACLQVLLSNVTSAGFYKIRSAFVKHNIKKVGHSIIPLVSTRFAFGVRVGVYFLLFVI